MIRNKVTSFISLLATSDSPALVISAPSGTFSSADLPITPAEGPRSRHPWNHTAPLLILVIMTVTALASEHNGDLSKPTISPDTHSP